MSQTTICAPHSTNVPVTPAKGSGLGDGPRPRLPSLRGNRLRLLFSGCLLRVRSRGGPQAELLTTLYAGAVLRVVLVRLDLGVQAHLAVLAGCRRDVFRPERVVHDLVAREPRFVVTLGTDAAVVPTDVLRLLDRREEFECAFRR